MIRSPGKAEDQASSVMLSHGRLRGVQAGRDRIRNSSTSTVCQNPGPAVTAVATRYPAAVHAAACLSAAGASVALRGSRLQTRSRAWPGQAASGQRPPNHRSRPAPGRIRRLRRFPRRPWRGSIPPTRPASRRTSSPANFKRRNCCRCCFPIGRAAPKRKLKPRRSSWPLDRDQATAAQPPEAGTEAGCACEPIDRQFDVQARHPSWRRENPHTIATTGIDLQHGQPAEGQRPRLRGGHAPRFVHFFGERMNVRAP